VVWCTTDVQRCRHCKHLCHAFGYKPYDSCWELVAIGAVVLQGPLCWVVLPEFLHICPFIIEICEHDTQAVRRNISPSSSDRCHACHIAAAVPCNDQALCCPCYHLTALTRLRARVHMLDRCLQLLQHGCG